MEIVKGICLPWNRGIAIGRLRFSKEPPIGEGEAILWVCQGDFRGVASSSVAGILRLGGEVSLTLPLSRPVMTLPGLAEENEGQIAILDAGRETLWISPELEQLRAYAEGERCSCGEEEVRFFGWSEKVSEASAEGIVLEEPLREDEEGLFEFYRSVAEGYPGRSLMAKISPGEEAATRRRLRALYRAAVYGCFSLLAMGITTDGEGERFCSLCHGVFCDLESEGREFNGYLPRGVLLDRGMPLLGTEGGRRWDFVCVEGEGLYASLAGEEKVTEEAIRTLRGALARFKGERPLWFYVRNHRQWAVTEKLLREPGMDPRGMIVPVELLNEGNQRQV